MEKLSKSEIIDLFDKGLEFGYIGVYDMGKRIDSRQMGIDYILELISEMVEFKNAYKYIELYYGGNGEVYKLPNKDKHALDYFKNAYYEMI